MSMFNFLLDGMNYETRVVGRWDSEDGMRMVSTAAVSDGGKPYETAFMHPEYNDGRMVIVDAYDSKEAASAGHEKWLKVMTEGPLPDELRDVQNAGLAQMCGALDDDWGIYKRVHP